MSTLHRVYELDTPIIPLHQQPAALIDLALARGINLDRLLRGTRLFQDQLLEPGRQITPDQFYQLMDNGIRLLDNPDTAFLFGQRILPGHYGAVSEQLRHAHTLHEALECLTTGAALFSPLLAPRLVLDDHYGYLFWVDTCRPGHQRRFLVEAAMTAVYALSRQLFASKLPWECRFSYPQPRHIEQYWLHLGEQIRFDQAMDMMRIPRQYLHHPLTPGSGLTAQMIRQQAQGQLQQLSHTQGFLQHLYLLLETTLKVENPRQERIAAQLGMSTSGLKRLLKKHHTSYQQQLDQVRKLTALQLIQWQQFSNEDVARLLHINDAANFRRCFKRWTGLAPNQLRAQWVK